MRTKNIQIFAFVHICKHCNRNGRLNLRCVGILLLVVGCWLLSLSWSFIFLLLLLLLLFFSFDVSSFNRLFMLSVEKKKKKFLSVRILMIRFDLVGLMLICCRILHQINKWTLRNNHFFYVVHVILKLKLKQHLYREWMFQMIMFFPFENSGRELHVGSSFRYFSTLVYLLEGIQNIQHEHRQQGKLSNNRSIFIYTDYSVVLPSYGVPYVQHALMPSWCLLGRNTFFPKPTPKPTPTRPASFNFLSE